MVRLITDSSADLEPREYEQLNITCIPLNVIIGEKEYQENVNLSKDQFYDLLAEGESPKTSQPSPQLLLDLFEEAKEAGDEALYIFISGAISGLVGFIVVSGANGTLYHGVADGVGFTSITVAWLAQLNAFAMVAISALLAILTKGAETLQTRLAVPASISEIITGILLFCMLGCEFFINFRLILRAKKQQKEAKAEGKEADENA